MPLNSTQRPIFVYLRSKNDHKSCTLAGAKLTNEYTHRTNKNDPSTISVIPSQLCTFFRKRTKSLGRVELSNSGKKPFQRWKLSFPALENLFSSLGKLTFQPWKFYFPSLERFWKVDISAGSYRPLPHKYVESVSLARARLTLCVVLTLYSLDHIGDLPGESSQPLLRIV